MDDYESIFSEILGGATSLIFLFIVLLLGFIVVAVIANWKMYKKAGKKGWECIVPIYSYWVLTEIAGLNWWWFLLAISDSIVEIIGLEDVSSIMNLVSLFASFNIYYNIAKRFGKSNGTSVCAGIFSGIFVLIFGFSKNEVYNVNIPVSKDGIFGTPEANFNNNVNNQENNTDVSTSTVERTNSYCSNCGSQLNKDIRFCPNCGKENI